MAVQVRPAEDPHQDPHPVYVQFANQRVAGSQNALLLVPFTYEQAWLNQEPVELVAVYFFCDDSVQYGVVRNGPDVLSSWNKAPSDLETALCGWMAKQEAPLFPLHEPLRLHPVTVRKPWGQEIWYTGVEDRGVASFSRDALHVPIPYLLAAMPSLCGQADRRALILLKILDPVPEAVFGDLYFELHEEKQEVYVVTHIDKAAWPDGVGQMRLGFHPDKVGQASDEAEFRQQFLQRVLAYREVRAQIDELLDENRRQNGIALTAEVPVDVLRRWLADVPAALASQEKSLREQMESFYGSLPLQVGDVVKVPLKVPHSLQHGVRTIEFQTPVYERLILAFAQKVLTQRHWDTERAVANMEVTTPSQQQRTVLRDEDGVHVESVVDFSDFHVQRITLPATATLPLHCSAYRLLIVITGGLSIGDAEVEEEEAVLLPAASTDFEIQSMGPQDTLFLIASSIDETIPDPA